MSTVKARVTDKLLERAGQLFDGSVSSRVTELLQNARRAGATKIDINVRELGEDKGNLVTVKDNGIGIDDFQSLLTLGKSDWNLETQLAEDAFGAGFFSLAPNKVTVSSKGKQICLADTADWIGKNEVPVTASSLTSKDQPGTVVQFVDPGDWLKCDELYEQAMFGDVDITVNSKVVPRFNLDAHAIWSVDIPEFNCRLLALNTSKGSELNSAISAVDANFDLRSCHYHYPYHGRYSGELYVNFHGLLIRSHVSSVFGTTICFMVLPSAGGFTGGLKLKAPDRDDIVDGPVKNRFESSVRLGVLRYMAEKHPHNHDLSFLDWKFAKANGVIMPEAKPRFNCPFNGYREGISLNYGTHWHDYKFDSDAVLFHADEDDAVVEALACIFEASDKSPVVVMPDGSEKSFLPVHFQDRYAGYSWCSGLPKITSDDFKVVDDGGEVLVIGYLGSLSIHVHKNLRYEAKFSNGSSLSIPVSVAASAPTDANGKVYRTKITRKAFDGGVTTLLHWLSGGYNTDDGDSWETQSDNFSEELQSIEFELLGEYAEIHSKLFSKLSELFRYNDKLKNWESIVISRGCETIRILTSDNNKEVVIKPPLIFE